MEKNQIYEKLWKNTASLSSRVYLRSLVGAYRINLKFLDWVVKRIKNHIKRLEVLKMDVIPPNIVSDYEKMKYKEYEKFRLSHEKPVVMDVAFEEIKTAEKVRV